jgi:CheY-like chemotaxis protein
MAKILIIDDERAIRNTLREILEYEDYQVEDVDNGIDGLELIEKTITIWFFAILK